MPGKATGRILLIRHGQDEPGYRGGWSQRGLTAEGMAQCRLLAENLCLHWQPIRFLMSSDLKRAWQTAEYIAQELNLPVQAAPLWREANNGEIAGMSNALVEQRYPGLYFSSLEMDEPYPGGESPRQFYQRAILAFEDLCTKMLDQELPSDVLVVTHAGVINSILTTLKGLIWSNKQPSFPASFTSIHEITHFDGRWRITVENSLEHLQTREGSVSHKTLEGF